MTDHTTSAPPGPPHAVVYMPRSGGGPRWLAPVGVALGSGAILWAVVSLLLVFSAPQSFVPPDPRYVVAFALFLAPALLTRSYVNRRDEPAALWSPHPGTLAIYTLGGRTATLSVAAVKEFDTQWRGTNVQTIDLVLRDGARLRLTPKPVASTKVTYVTRRLVEMFIDQAAEAGSDPRPPEQIEGVTITEERSAPTGYRANASERALQAEWSADPRQTYRGVALATMAAGAGALLVAYQIIASPIISGAFGVWCVGCAGYALMRLLRSDARVRVRLDRETFALTTWSGGDPPAPKTVPISAIRSLKWAAISRLELSYDEPSEIGAPRTMALPMMSLSFIDQLALERLLSAEIAERKGVSAAEM